MSKTEKQHKTILKFRSHLSRASNISEKIQTHQAVISMLDSTKASVNAASSEDSAVDTEMSGKPLNKRQRKVSPVMSRVQSVPALAAGKGFVGFEPSSTEEGTTSSSSVSKTPRRSQSQTRFSAISTQSLTPQKATRAKSSENLIALTPDAKQRIFNYEFRGPIPRNHHCQRSIFGRTIDVPDDPTTTKRTPVMRKRPFKSPISAGRKPCHSAGLRTALQTSKLGLTLHETACDAHRSKPTPGSVVTASKSDTSVAQQKLDDWKPRENAVFPPEATISSIPPVASSTPVKAAHISIDFTSPISTQPFVVTSPNTPYEFYTTPATEMGNGSSESSFMSAKEDQTPVRRSNIRRIERPPKSSDSARAARVRHDERRQSIESIRATRDICVSQINQALETLTPKRGSRMSKMSPTRSESFTRPSVILTPDSNFVGRSRLIKKTVDEEANVENDPPIEETNNFVANPNAFEKIEVAEKPAIPDAAAPVVSPTLKYSASVNRAMTSLTPEKLFENYSSWLRLYFNAKKALLKLAAEYCEREGDAGKARAFRKEIESFKEQIERLKTTVRVWCQEFSPKYVEYVLNKMAELQTKVRGMIAKRNKLRSKFEETRKSINFSFLGTIEIDQCELGKVSLINKHLKTVSQMASMKPRAPPVPTMPSSDSARSQSEIESSEASKAALLALETAAKEKRDELRALRLNRKADRAQRRVLLESELASLNTEIAAVLSERRASLSSTMAPILSARHLPEGTERLSLIPKLDLSLLVTPRPSDTVKVVSSQRNSIEEQSEIEEKEEKDQIEVASPLPPPAPIQIEFNMPAAGDVVTPTPLSDSGSLTMISSASQDPLTPSLLQDTFDQETEKPAEDPVESVFSERRTSRDGESLGALESLPQDAAPPSPEATENDVSTMRDIQDEEGNVALIDDQKEAEIVPETNEQAQFARTLENDALSVKKDSTSESQSGFSAFSSLSSAQNNDSEELASLPGLASSPESTKEAPSIEKHDENELELVTSNVDDVSIEEEIQPQQNLESAASLSSDPEHLPSTDNSAIFPSGIISSDLLEDSPIPSPPKPEEPSHVDEVHNDDDPDLKPVAVSDETSSSTTSSPTKSKTTTNSGTTLSSTTPTESSARSIETVSDEAPSALQSASSAMSSSTPNDESSLIEMPKNDVIVDQNESIVEEMPPPPSHFDEDVSLTTDDFSTSFPSEFNRSGRRRSHERVETGQILKRFGSPPTYQRGFNIDDDGDNANTSLENIKFHAAPPLSPFACVSPRNSMTKTSIFNRSRSSEQRDSLGSVTDGVSEASNADDSFDLMNNSLTDLMKKDPLFDLSFGEIAPRVSDGKDVSTWSPGHSKYHQKVLNASQESLKTFEAPKPPVAFEPPLTTRTDDLTSGMSSYETVKSDYNSVLLLVDEACHLLWIEIENMQQNTAKAVDLQLYCGVKSSEDLDYYQEAFKMLIYDTVVAHVKPLIQKGVKFANEEALFASISKQVLPLLSIDCTPDILHQRHIWNKLSSEQPPSDVFDALMFKKIYEVGADEVKRFQNNTCNGVFEVLKVNAPEQFNKLEINFTKTS